MNLNGTSCKFIKSKKDNNRVKNKIKKITASDVLCYI